MAVSGAAALEFLGTYAGGIEAGAAAVGAGAAVYSATRKIPGAPKMAQKQGAKNPTGSTTTNPNQMTPGQGGGQPGVAPTFLTGTQGVDPSMLSLGKSTLLGG